MRRQLGCEQKNKSNETIRNIRRRGNTTLLLLDSNSLCDLKIEVLDDALISTNHPP